MKPSERAAELARLEWEQLVEMENTGMDPDVSMRHVLAVLDEIHSGKPRQPTKQERCGSVGHVFGRNGRPCVFCGVRP